MSTKGEKTKEKITRAAAELFRRQGFSATTVNDVLETTGVKKGCLYFHFPGKDDLALEVLRRAEEEFLDFLDAALSGPTPADRLDNLFRSALELHRGSGFVGGCMFGNTALEASDCNPLYASRVAEVFDRWRAKIEAVILDALAEEQIRDDLPADVIAQLVISTVEGGIMLARLKKDEEPLSQCIDSLRILLELKLEKEKVHAAH